jgi:hypothetical protein
LLCFTLLCFTALCFTSLSRPFHADHAGVVLSQAPDTLAYSQMSDEALMCEPEDAPTGGLSNSGDYDDDGSDKDNDDGSDKDSDEDGRGGL